MALPNWHILCAFSMYLQRLHGDIRELSWPAGLKEAGINILPDGQLSLNAANDHARITLAPHRQHFTTHYLAKVSREPVRTSATKRNSQKICHQQQQITSNVNDVVYESNCSSRWDYVWLSQHHSVEQYPECWAHPLELLLQQAKQKRVTLASDTNNGKGDADEPDLSTVAELTKVQNGHGDQSDRVSTEVPATLPLNCQAQHLHKWKPSPGTGEELEASFVSSKVKVVCCQGIVYRYV